MPTKRFLIIIALLAAVNLMLAACGSSASQPKSLALTIHAQDIKFDLTALTARVDQPVSLTYVNEGMIDHAFVIDGLVSEQKVKPGETLTFTFTPHAAGAFKFYCAMPGHEMAGMVGTLTVAP
jgi:plastocyanin